MNKKEMVEKLETIRSELWDAYEQEPDESPYPSDHWEWEEWKKTKNGKMFDALCLLIKARAAIESIPE